MQPTSSHPPGTTWVTADSLPKKQNKGRKGPKMPDQMLLHGQQPPSRSLSGRVKRNRVEEEIIDFLTGAAVARREEEKTYITPVVDEVVEEVEKVKETPPPRKSFKLNPDNTQNPNPLPVDVPSLHKDPDGGFGPILRERDQEVRKRIRDGLKGIGRKKTSVSADRKRLKKQTFKWKPSQGLDKGVQVLEAAWKQEAHKKVFKIAEDIAIYCVHSEILLPETVQQKFFIYAQEGPWHRHLTETKRTERRAISYSHLAYRLERLEPELRDEKLLDEYYRKASELGDENAGYNLGLRYEARKEHQEAFKIWSPIAANEHVLEVHNHLGLLFENGHVAPPEGNSALETAASHFNKGWELGCVDSAMNLARLYTENGIQLKGESGIEAAVKIYRKVAKDKHEPVAYFNIAALILQKKIVPMHDKECLDCLTTIEALDPNLNGLWSAYGEYWMQNGDTTKAEQCFTKAIGSQDYEAAWHLANLQFSQGRIQDAIDNYILAARNREFTLKAVQHLLQIGDADINHHDKTLIAALEILEAYKRAII